VLDDRWVLGTGDHIINSTPKPQGVYIPLELIWWIGNWRGSMWEKSPPYSNLNKEGITSP
jgi:hypothetical protein